MTDNPYLELQSDRNPYLYLEAAMSREAEARMIRKLARLVPDSVSPELQSTAPVADRSVYQSALEGPVTSFSDRENDGAARSGLASYGQTPVSKYDSNEGIDEGSIVLETGLDGGRDRNPYCSPETLRRGETAQGEPKQQHLTRQQHPLEQQPGQQISTCQSRLKIRARAFLKKIEALDPLEGERLWFESFAALCSSRLEAAMELVAIAPNDLDNDGGCASRQV